jgi:hypothetical protein
MAVIMAETPTEPGALGSVVLSFGNLTAGASTAEYRPLKLLDNGTALYFTRIARLDDAADLTYCVWDPDADDCHAAANQTVGETMWVAIFIQDEGPYDMARDDLGNVTDPVMLSRVDEGGGTSAGCSLHPAAGPGAEWLLLLLWPALFLAARLRRAL